MQYVKEMRKLIGTKPLLVCGASVIISDNNGKVLMLHRSDNDSWCFPGGSLDLGESTENTARREVYEETGLHVDQLQIFDVFSGEELHYTYPHGDEVYIVDVVYKTNHFTGNLKIDKESKAFKFFPLTELPDNISPPVVPVVRKLLEQAGI